MSVPLIDFIEGLNLYVRDEIAIDRAPLLGWWNFGGEPHGDLGVSLTHDFLRVLYLEEQISGAMESL